MHCILVDITVAQRVTNTVVIFEEIFDMYFQKIFKLFFTSRECRCMSIVKGTSKSKSFIFLLQTGLLNSWYFSILPLWSLQLICMFLLLNSFICFHYDSSVFFISPPPLHFFKYLHVFILFIWYCIFYCLLSASRQQYPNFWHCKILCLPANTICLSHLNTCLLKCLCWDNRYSNYAWTRRDYGLSGRYSLRG